jgi:3-oxoacyl-[acyl-carrier protein] reductase
VSELKGKSVLVTGGSRGIGAGIVKYLATKGARVAFTYSSNQGSAEKLASDLPGTGHLVLPLDVTQPHLVDACISACLKNFGQLDGLVNNAGITKDQLLLRMKDADFDEVLQTNLRGVFLCTRAVIKPMMKARRGSIVNITSVVGHSGNAGQANYAASKAAVDAFAKSIAQEMGSRNIRVNNVAPGFITTDMTDVLTETQKSAFLQKIPLQKFGDVNDVAAAVAFLISDDSAYITGQTLHVNGGMWM